MRLLNGTGFRFTETTSAAERLNGTRSYCSNYIGGLDLPSVLVGHEAVTTPGPQKIRYYFDLSRATVTVAPICPLRLQPSLAEQVLKGDLPERWFVDAYAGLDEAVAAASDALRQGAFRSGPKCGFALLQALTFLVEYILGMPILAV